MESSRNPPSLLPITKGKRLHNTRSRSPNISRLRRRLPREQENLRVQSRDQPQFSASVFRKSRRAAS